MLDIYFEEDMKQRPRNDRLEAYSVTFWHVKADNYFGRKTITMFMKKNTSDDKVLKALRKRYKRPILSSVDYQ